MHEHALHPGLVLLALTLLVLCSCEALISLEDPPPVTDWSSWIFPATDGEAREQFMDEVHRDIDGYVDSKNREAQDISDRLESYIYAWLAGDAPAELPEGLLPEGIDNEKTKSWTLIRREDVRSEEQWGMRPAEAIPEDYSALHFLSPDNNASYFKLFFVAPYGTQLVIEGDYPHARFFDLQITPPFNPLTPADAGFGALEVPIVDVDIEPEPGNVNPFRVGADRTALNRRYRVTFDLAAGDAEELNPEALRIPAYRGGGSHRVGGPFFSGGPYSLGQIHGAVVWMRYYAPDKEAGPLGGVELPRAYLQLPTGEQFWIKTDFREASRVQNFAVAGFETEPEEPAAYLGPEYGWLKMFGIWLVSAEGWGHAAVHAGAPWSWAAPTVRKMYERSYFRGEALPSIGHHESSATACSYISYLVRPMSLGRRKVIAVSGRLPRAPATRDGEPIMEAAEARYWSLCHTASDPEERYPKILYGCVMDDEIATNESGQYVIVFSRPEDRPRNATAENGVTWQSWGPPATQDLVIRWLSVMPEWNLPDVAPNEANLPWATTSWSGTAFDPTLVGRNRSGFLGAYHPVLSYTTVEEFEALGDAVSAAALPRWQ